MSKILLNSLLLTCLAAGTLLAQSSAKRPLKPSDVYRLKSVSEPKVSPDGGWVAYVLSSADSAANKRKKDLWMVSWDGKESLQLTHTPDNESSPEWSPDGKYLSFISSRGGLDQAQLWLMDRRGGEAKKITSLKHSLEDYAWSPDGKQIALAIKTLADTSTNKKTKDPIVTDRFKFKQDIEGYLIGETTHLYVYTLATNKIDTLTKGDYNESSPVWSPDGRFLAFVSNRTPEPDRNTNTDIWVMEAKPAAPARQLTTWQGSDSSPRWSPDGKTIAYLRSSSETYSMYDQSQLAVVPAQGGSPKVLSQSLDRDVSTIRWSADGKSVYGLVDDDRQSYVARFDASTGKSSRVADGEKAFTELKKHPNGEWLTILSTPTLPAELYALEKGATRRLTMHQDSFMAPLAIAAPEGFTSTSKDGTKVSGLLFRPPGNASGKNLPLLVFIHGGPVAQDDWGFDLERQMLAAGGYAVAAVNYRGSNGRGAEFTRSIYADWGNLEVVDLLGAVDYLVKEGIADPERLGIGGWSYGGILTNATIATDTRFKAAASGAGVSMQLSFYGVDQYILQNENELGLPWKNIDNYLKVGFPFLHADRIKTPTLFMVGEKDFNVPAAGTEQMYQALRSLGVPTQLVIYPGQYHGISVPSYQKDRFERYLKWFDKYLDVSK
ncbi:S9 family peptidase [Arundinibacter roseus]|uniref:Acyl-peptide hydrolase n=1 Tax=Arundinibacter roseus TaxID=2070510 RepID=A0A4V2XAK7_9BACT|nr:S9 family peptidase [Arundinibacter roseus]TDB67995.1 S9 family peptidase [Arundinibacter roseus]